MHEHKIYNHIIYHKCVQNYQYLLCLYKHATAYLLPCIICINSEHSTSISGSALSALISIITTPVLISCVDYKHCKGFWCCDKTHIQLMIQFILFRVDLQAEILASMDIRPMLCIPAMLVKQLATFCCVSIDMKDFIHLTITITNGLAILQSIIDNRGKKTLQITTTTKQRSPTLTKNTLYFLSKNRHNIYW